MNDVGEFSEMRGLPGRIQRSESLEDLLSRPPRKEQGSRSWEAGEELGAERKSVL